MNQIINSSLKLTGQPTYDSYILKFNKEVGLVNLESIKNWISAIKPKYSPSTIRILKAGIKKGIMRTLQRESYYMPFIIALDQNFRDIKVNKPDRKIYKEKILRDEEVDTLVENCSRRIGIIIKTLYITGLRISELLNVRISSCSHDNQYCYINIIGKGSKERRIFIPESLFLKIRDEFNGEIYLFESSPGKKITRQYA